VVLCTREGGKEGRMWCCRKMWKGWWWWWWCSS
jgi:hypothetical protein